MKRNLTSSPTIQVVQELRVAPIAADHSTTSAGGFAVALFIRPSPENTIRFQPEAVAAVPGSNDSIFPPSLDAIYKCKNCGKRMKLADATNYYGLPACPACVQACAPFEIVPESLGSNPDPSPNS